MHGGDRNEESEVLLNINLCFIVNDEFLNAGRGTERAISSWAVDI